MTLTLPKILGFTAMMMPALLAFGCGEKSKAITPPAAGATAGLNAASNCKSKTDCPDAVAGFGANMAPGGSYVGWMGESINWRAFGIDENTKSVDGTTSTRRMTVLLDKVPEGSSIVPGVKDKLKNEAFIEWTPKKESKGKLDVIVRDAERCEVERGTDGYCNTYNFLSDYDVRFKDLRWEIKDKDALAEQIADGTLSAEDGGVAGTNCTGASTTTDKLLNAQVMNTFIQALSGGNTAGGGLLQMGTTLYTSGAFGGGTGTAQPKC